jgi:hypothetical protein
MDKILCKKDFYYSEKYNFEKGVEYYYWTNFGGLNHFVSKYHYENGGSDFAFPFDSYITSTRPYLYEYFCTKEEYRDFKINNIIC